jgi:CheY-like chemotaxis protein
MKRQPRPLSVLIVDPDAGRAARLDEAMRRRGWVVTTVVGPRAAIDVAGGVVPDAVVVALPADPAGAIALAKELRRLVGKKPPVLVTLEGSGAGHPQRPRGSPFDFHWAESSDAGELAALLAQHVRQ